MWKTVPGCHFLHVDKESSRLTTEELLEVSSPPSVTELERVLAYADAAPEAQGITVREPCSSSQELGGGALLLTVMLASLIKHSGHYN